MLGKRHIQKGVSSTLTRCGKRGRKRPQPRGIPVRLRRASLLFIAQIGSEYASTIPDWFGLGDLHALNGLDCRPLQRHLVVRHQSISFETAPASRQCCGAAGRGSGDGTARRAGGWRLCRHPGLKWPLAPLREVPQEVKGGTDACVADSRGGHSLPQRPTMTSASSHCS